MSDRRGRRVFTTHFSRVLPPKPPPLPVRCRATGVSLGGLLRRFAKDSELGGRWRHRRPGRSADFLAARPIASFGPHREKLRLSRNPLGCLQGIGDAPRRSKLFGAALDESQGRRSRPFSAPPTTECAPEGGCYFLAS